MKRIILTVAAVFAFGFANAQDITITDTEGMKGFKEGDMWAEGSFSFRSGDIEDSWSFSPKIGYMIKENIGIGGFLAFSGTDDNRTDFSEDKYGFGAFARYYFLSLGKSKEFQAYGEVGLGYSSVKTNGEFDEFGNFIPYGDDHTDGQFNANIDLGINYFFTSNWAATFELANIVSYNNSNPESGDNSSDLNVEVNLFNNIFAQPQFGLLYKW